MRAPDEKRDSPMITGIRLYWQNYIDGAWVDGAEGTRITVTDPATGATIAEVARAAVMKAVFCAICARTSAAI
jgi:aldehyde dehydrogenase (NAD+)